MKRTSIVEEQEEEVQAESEVGSGDETDEMSEAEAFLHTSEEMHKKARDGEDKLKRLAGRRRRGAFRFSIFLYLVFTAERRHERMAALNEDFRALVNNTALSSTGGGVKTAFVSDDHEKVS